MSYSVVRLYEGSPDKWWGPIRYKTTAMAKAADLAEKLATKANQRDKLDASITGEVVYCMDGCCAVEFHVVPS